jgi:hypothetical protein
LSSSSFLGEVRMTSLFNHAKYSYLWDHKVLNQILVPAAAMIDACAASLQAIKSPIGKLSSQVMVKDVTIISPFTLPSTVNGNTPKSFQMSIKKKYGTLELASIVNDVDSTKIVHLRAIGSHLTTHFGKLRGTSNAQEKGMNIFPLDIDISSTLDNFGRQKGIVAMGYIVRFAKNQQDEQHLVHPITIDNCTQVGSSLIGLDTKEDSKRILRVPAGVHAYVLDDHKRDQFGFASAAIINTFKDGTVLCDNHLNQLTQSATRLIISGMSFRHLANHKVSHAAVRKASKTTTFRDHMHMYKIEWATLQPLRYDLATIEQIEKAHDILANGKCAMTWDAFSLDKTKVEHVKITCTKDMAIASPALKSLEFIQTNSAVRMEAGLVRMISFEAGSNEMQCLHEARSYNLFQSCAAASLSGLIRVAAQELPKILWDQIAIGVDSQLKFIAHHQLASPDVMGASFKQGQLSQPKLCRVNVAGDNARTFDAIEHCGGSFLVTGGLGSIGMLSGAWAASIGYTNHVYLISRSGHANGMPLAMGNHNGAMHILRCDGSVQSEISAMMRCVHTRSPLLQGIFHASGLLHDSPILKQVSNSLK